MTDSKHTPRSGADDVRCNVVEIAVLRAYVKDQRQELDEQSRKISQLSYECEQMRAALKNFSDLDTGVNSPLWAIKPEWCKQARKALGYLDLPVWRDSK